MHDTGPDLESTLADVARISLAQLESLDESVLSRALRRLLEDSDTPSEILAGFQSSILPYEPRS